MKRIFTKFLYTSFLCFVVVSSFHAQELSRTNSHDYFKKFEVRHTSDSGQSSDISPRGTVYFEEGFESNSFTTNGWVITDADGDGQKWFISNTLTSHSGTYTAGSASWNNNKALTPNNWMASKAIDLTSASGTILLEYWVRAQDQVWPSEFYGVFASKTGNKPADFTGADGKELFKEKVEKGTDTGNKLYVKRTLDLSSYIGGKVYIAFRHYNCTDQFVLDIDDISVFESTTVDVGIVGVVAPNNKSNCALQNQENVTVTLFNYGGVKQTGFLVYYKHNGVTVVDTFKEDLLPASSKNFTFKQKAAFTELGYYTLDFEVKVSGDTKPDNNKFSYKVANTDANIKIEVSTDGSGGQAWEIVSSDGTVIASHGAYQWNIKDTTTICVKSQECYTFNWYGGNKNTVKVYYNDQLKTNKEATGNFTVYSIGGNCKPVNVLYQYQSLPEYGIIGNNNLGGRFLNIGVNNIISLDAQYTVNGTPSTVYNINNLNIAPGETYDFVHNAPYNFDKVGKYQVTVKITNFNGTFTPDNNVQAQTYYVLSFKPFTRVLGEEATGTWCGWCVRGHYFMDKMDETYPNTWVGVAVHNGDPMVVTAYDTGMGDFIAGYPSGLVNRFKIGDAYDIDPKDFELAHNVFKDFVVPANIAIGGASYDAATKKLQFSIEANFAGNIDKSYNVLGIITEDEVKGTDAGYDQVNYYAGGANGPMGGYESLPNPVPASQMVYENVARALLGGFNGVSNVIPNPTADNGKYTYSFSYTVPQKENIDHMNLIGVILDKTSGEVVNVVKKSYKKAVSVETTLPDLVDFTIYPNPGFDVLNIDFNLDQKEKVTVFITDITGRIVKKVVDDVLVQNYSKTINISDLNKGIYLVNVQSKNGVSVQKLIKE
ncbi:MAG: choice-of-anchor J domain-containing protein [Deltaproteobacteria bacterium]